MFKGWRLKSYTIISKAIGFSIWLFRKLFAIWVPSSSSDTHFNLCPHTHFAMVLCRRHTKIMQGISLNKGRSQYPFPQWGFEVLEENILLTRLATLYPPFCVCVRSYWTKNQKRATTKRTGGSDRAENRQHTLMPNLCKIKEIHTLQFEPECGAHDVQMVLSLDSPSSFLIAFYLISRMGMGMRMNGQNGGNVKPLCTPGGRNKNSNTPNSFSNPLSSAKPLLSIPCLRFAFCCPLMWQQKQIHRKTVEPATCWSQGMGRHMGKGKTATSIVQAALFDAQQSHCVGGLEMRQLQAKWERFFNISYSHIYKYPSSPESIWIRVPILKRYCAPIHLIIYAMAIEM